jgi:hypothetical protein
VAQILDEYNRGSGQLVKKHKSAIFSVLTVNMTQRLQFTTAYRLILKPWGEVLGFTHIGGENF